MVRRLQAAVLVSCTVGPMPSNLQSLLQATTPASSRPATTQGRERRDQASFSTLLPDARGPAQARPAARPDTAPPGPTPGVMTIRAPRRPGPTRPAVPTARHPPGPPSRRTMSPRRIGPTGPHRRPISRARAGRKRAGARRKQTPRHPPTHRHRPRRPPHRRMLLLRLSRRTLPPRPPSCLSRSRSRCRASQRPPRQPPRPAPKPALPPSVRRLARAARSRRHLTPRPRHWPP